MTRLRLLANILVAVILVAVLVGLVAISVDERCSRNVSADETAGMVQSIPFGGKL